MLTFTANNTTFKSDYAITHEICVNTSPKKIIEKRSSLKFAP